MLYTIIPDSGVLIFYREVKNHFPCCNCFVVAILPRIVKLREQTACQNRRYIVHCCMKIWLAKMSKSTIRKKIKIQTHCQFYDKHLRCVVHSSGICGQNYFGKKSFRLLTVNANVLSLACIDDRCTPLNIYDNRLTYISLRMFLVFLVKPQAICLTSNLKQVT